MTFDLSPEFRGPCQAKFAFRTVSERLKPVGMFAGDMDMDRCWEVKPTLNLATPR